MVLNNTKLNDIKWHYIQLDQINKLDEVNRKGVAWIARSNLIEIKINWIELN